jgi:hypothetical protein
VKHITAPLLVAIMIVAGTTGEATAATSSVSACAGKKGALRLATKCRKSERRVKLLVAPADVAGTPGATGPKGEAGVPGAKGETGAGNAGAKGETGAQGATGTANAESCPANNVVQGVLANGSLACTQLPAYSAGAGLGLTGNVFSLAPPITLSATSAGPILQGANTATNGNGSGVLGSHAGSGTGVRGTSVGGTGVAGQSTSGAGIVATSSGSGPALSATNDGSGPAAAFTSTVSPFTVNSSTKVDSLNADLLDGRSASDFGRAAVAVVSSYSDPGTFVERTKVVIDAPRDGLMLVMGSASIGTLIGGDTSCNPCRGAIRLRHDVEDPAEDPLGFQQVETFGDGIHESSAQLATSWVFVVEAGRLTFALDAATTGAAPSSIFVDNPTVTALYVPFGPSG